MKQKPISYYSNYNVCDEGKGGGWILGDFNDFLKYRPGKCLNCSVFNFNCFDHDHDYDDDMTMIKY